MTRNFVSGRGVDRRDRLARYCRIHLTANSWIASPDPADQTAHTFKQSGVVLKYIAAARDAGLAVIFISHNPHHAYLVGDRFAVLSLGRVELDAARSDISLEQLIRHVAGGAELRALEHELGR